MEQAKKQEGLVPATEASIQPDNVARGYFWFVAQGSLLKGPYSTTELKKLIDKKEMSEKFFAWRDGYREWRPLYGIEEFKSDKQAEAAYPSVPVPGVASSTPATVTNTENTIRERKVPVYKVRFNRSRWSDLKKTEIVVLFLGCLVFTLSILSLTFHVFQKEWDGVWGRRTSSMLYPLGVAENAMPLYMLEPLKSAPGLKMQESHLVAVEVESDMDRVDPTRFAGMKLDGHFPVEGMQNLKWDETHTYNRRMRVQGFMDLKNPAFIQVEMPGLPYEPLLSARSGYISH